MITIRFVYIDRLVFLTYVSLDKLSCRYLRHCYGLIKKATHTGFPRRVNSNAEGCTIDVKVVIHKQNIRSFGQQILYDNRHVLVVILVDGEFQSFGI